MKDDLHGGMTMQAARAILGPPDGVDEDGTWVYDVDFEPDGLLGTCVKLQLYPDNGRLTSFELLRDS